MIQAVTGLPENVIGFACRGHLTRQDYETIVIPTLGRPPLYVGGVR
jgi:hypothetical protein